MPPHPRYPPPTAKLQFVEGSIWRAVHPHRIIAARTPAVFWVAWVPAWRPATVTGWVRDTPWMVRLRVRFNAKRDTETWYYFDARLILPLDLDQADLDAWMPQRPTS